MDLELAEALGEGDMSRSRELWLVTEKDDLVVHQRLADLGGHLVGEVGPELDAAQLRTDRGAEERCLEVLPHEPGETLALGLQVPERPRFDVERQTNPLRHRCGHGRTLSLAWRRRPESNRLRSIPCDAAQTEAAWIRTGFVRPASASPAHSRTIPSASRSRCSRSPAGFSRSPTLTATRSRSVSSATPTSP